MGRGLCAALFLLSILLCLLCRRLRRGEMILALGSAVCCVAGVLTGLLAGLELEALLTPLLLLCAVSMTRGGRREDAL